MRSLMCVKFLPMTCTFCSQYSQDEVQHESHTCPHLASMNCRRCQSYGHLVSQCETRWEHWERPSSLEELIPYHLRVRYGIQSTTVMDYDTERGSEESFRELTQEISVPGNDKKMRKFMENYGIKTVHKGAVNLQTIKDWARDRGLRVRITND
jgi:hypothetical protein